MAQKVMAPVPKWQFDDEEGRPAAGHKIFIYQAGTTTKTLSYTDATGLTPNTNPIILDARGECSVWIPGVDADETDSLPPGPAGPEGPAGPPGPQGIPGAPGLSNFPMVAVTLTPLQIVNLNDFPVEILPLPPIDYYYAVMLVLLQSTIVGGGFSASGGLAMSYTDADGLEVWDVNYPAGGDDLLTQSVNCVDAPSLRIPYGHGFGLPTEANTFVPLTSVAGQKVVIWATDQWVPVQDPGPIVKIVKVGGGTGYAVDDEGTITGGDGNATYKVLAVSTGAVTEVELTDGGDTYDNDTTVVTTATTGGGAGLLLDTFVIEGNNTQLRVACYYQFGVVQQLPGAILTTSLNAAGIDYVVGDTFAFVGGDSNATGVVDSVTGLGGVSLFSLTYRGSAYSIATGVATTSGGAGTGLTINILGVAL